MNRRQSSVRPRLAILSDFAEEQWPSMDLVAEMLTGEFNGPLADRVDVTRIVPAFRRRLTRLPWIGSSGSCRNADRLYNRMRVYPRYAARLRDDFDLFHVADHSYSQLVHQLPADRTGVFCHDLDTFQCLLGSEPERRPAWFRKMTSHVLRGMQKASVVFFSTLPVRDQMEREGLIDPKRLVHAPYGTSPEFTSTPADPKPLTGVLPDGWSARPLLLHVGSCISRKRIDVLLNVFAAVRSQFPDVRLAQVGGEWTGAQRSQIETLKVGDFIHQVRGISREALASLYRAAAVVLQPSEAEGFGLPVAEALACGAVVVASDIPVLREVGGSPVVYCPVADVPAWVETVRRLLDNPAVAPPLHERLARAAQFSWSSHARIILEAYLRLPA